MDGGDISINEGHSYNFTLESVYRHVVGDYASYARYKGPHWVIPSPNLNSEVSPAHVPLDSKFKFKVSMPRPVLAPTNNNPAEFKRCDPLDTVLYEKEEWQNDLNVLTKIARKAKKWADRQEYGLNTNKVRKKDIDKPIYSVDSYVNVARHFAEDPHPSFSGDYNWLPTGGSLATCSVNGENYILHPSGTSMDTLCVRGLNYKENLVVKGSSGGVCLRLANDQRVYQIVAGCIKSRGMACIRQENVCSVVKFKEGKTKPIHAQTVLEVVAKDTMFTSLDINPLDGSEFCTMDSSHIVKLWDLNASACIANAELPVSTQKTSSSSWGFTKFSNSPHQIYALNKSTIFVKDLRMPLAENQLQFSPRSILEECEELTYLLNSSNSSIVYAVTSHHLLSLDLRLGWTQRWSHLMESPPMFGSVYCDKRKLEEVVLLSSSLPGDKVAIVNSWAEGKPKSEALPTNLPSCGDFLLLANAQGKCLGPGLKRRLDMATSGLVVLPSEDNQSFAALQLTSVGDIFSQQFDPTVFDLGDMALTETDIEVWQVWEDAHEKVCAEKNPELVCETVNHAALFESVRAPLEKDKTRHSAVKQWQDTLSKKNPVPESDEDSFIKDLQYSKLLCDLGSCKDLMAGVLLQAWDTEGITIPPETSQYVESWLGSLTPSSFSSPYDETQRTPTRMSTRQTRHSLSSIPDTYLPGGKTQILSSAPTRMETRQTRHSLSSVPDAFNSTRNEGDDSVFKTPSTPNLRPRKKLKRESLGF